MTKARIKSTRKTEKKRLKKHENFPKKHENKHVL
jgi:hypothetical protein